MRLDLDGGACLGAGAFDDVGIQSSLAEKIERAELLGLSFEDANKLVADDPSFLLRIYDALEPMEKPVGCVDEDEIHPEIAAEDLPHDLSFVEAQEAVVDKDGSQTVANC